jgi:hypothetical protein
MTSFLVNAEYEKSDVIPSAARDLARGTGTFTPRQILRPAGLRMTSLK